MNNLFNKISIFIANTNHKYTMLVLTFLIIISSILYNSFKEYRHEELLSKNFKKTFAIYDDFNNAQKGKVFSSFYFFLRNKQIKFEEDAKHNFLKLGDTVLIKNSIKDPSVAKVIDFCYMKKHKGKEYCDN